MCAQRTKTYKLHEFAAALAPPDTEGPSLQKLKRRILNWTAAGLIRPVGGSRHQGSGVHRNFDHHELCKASALLELSRYRPSPVMLEMLAIKFDEAHPSKRTSWREKSFGHLVEIAQRGDAAFVHIQVDQDIEGKTVGYQLDWGDSLKLAENVHSQILLSLGRILQDLPDPVSE